MLVSHCLVKLVSSSVAAAAGRTDLAADASNLNRCTATKQLEATAQAVLCRVYPKETDCLSSMIYGKMCLRYLSITFLFALLPSNLLAHSGHDQVTLSPETESDWATRHMAEEHHISNFDPGAFFTLHDFDSSLTWSADEIRRLYGLDDESTKNVDEGKKAEVVRKTLETFDRDNDGLVERDEWLQGWRAGKRLEDFGLGPGHHGDDEYEYEIHHFEKFHDESEYS